ncbi:MAG: CHAT domain-containing tetratricopeptide repeat protein [Planctomycetota bacterium]
MRKISVAGMLLFCLLFSTDSVAQVATASNEIESPTPRTVFRDEFAKDSRTEYAVEGDVKWESGTLTLEPNGSISRAVNGSAWALLSLRIVPIKSDENDSLTKIRLTLDGATDCLLEIRSRREDQRILDSFQLLDTDERIAKSLPNLSRSLFDSLDLRLDYRHGLVRVTIADQRALIGYIKNGDSTVETIAIEASHGTSRLRQLSCSTTSRPSLRHTAAEKQRLDKAEQDNKALNQLSRTGRFQQAVTLGRQILRNRTELLDPLHPDVASSMSGLAYLLHRMGDHRGSKQLYEQTLKLRAALVGTEHPDYLNTLDNYGMLLHTLGDLDEATKLCEKAHRWRALVHGELHPAFSSSLNNLSLIYRSQGKFDRAEKLLIRSLEIKAGHSGTQDLRYATSLSNLAELYRSMGEEESAEPLFRQSMEIIGEVVGKQHPMYSLSMNNLALLYQSLGDYAQAEPLHRRANELMKASLGERHPSYASSLNNLAELYRQTGDFDRAEPLLKMALDVKRQTFGENHSNFANSLNNLGLLYDQMGDHARAAPLFEKSIAINAKTLGKGHPQYASTVNNLAGAYEELGNLERAEELYLEAKDVRLKTLGDESPFYIASLNNLAGLAQRQGKLSHADELYEQILEKLKRSLGDQHPYYGRSLLGRAVVKELLGENADAERLFAEAEAIVRSGIEDNAVVQSKRQQHRQVRLNRVFIDARISHAVSADASNVSMLASDLWKWKGSITARQRAYRQISNSPELTAKFGELRSVTHQLSVATTRFPYAPPKSAPAAVLEDFQRRRTQATERLALLTREREQLESAIASESAAYRNARKPITVAQVQSWLPDDGALVDFIEYTRHSPKTAGGVEYERRYAAVIVTKHGPAQLTGLGSASSIHSAIDAFRRPLAGQSVDDPSVAMRLRDEIWTPLERSLDGVSTVILSPDSRLGLLPFAALPGRTPGTFLVEDYRLASVPFAQLLNDLSNEPQQPPMPGLLVVGDVDFDRNVTSPPNRPALLAANQELGRLFRSSEEHTTQWQSLSGFEEESALVVSLFRKRYGEDALIETLTGARANEEQVLQRGGQSKIIHVVTHGFFSAPGIGSVRQSKIEPPVALEPESRGADPFFNKWMPSLLSGLVLAGANQQTSDATLDDGILRAAEIEASPMPGVDLIVLSACETGLGPVAGGEGLTGLQRAFHVAGARSVVASLWKVDDAATQELMRRFYTNLWIKKQSKIDALRNAQLWILRHPLELEAMGVQDAVRGAMRPRTKPSRPGSDAKTTAPFFWAAFQLSGDWE